MATLVGFGTFAALPEERVSDKISRRILSGDQGMLVRWSIGHAAVALVELIGNLEHRQHQPTLGRVTKAK